MADTKEDDVLDVLNDILNEMSANFDELRNTLDEIKETQFEVVEKIENISLPGRNYEITENP